MAIPVTIADARRQVRLDADDTSLDADLNDFIADAAAWVEKYTGHILVAREVTETFRVPGRIISLRAWPIADNDAAPTVVDNAMNPISGFRLDATLRPARLFVGSDTSWAPDQYLTATIRAGYEENDHVPGNLRRAMLILISAYESDREGGDLFQKAEIAARKLCSSFRQHSL